MAPRQLSTLLSMPASIRQLLLATPVSCSSRSQMRMFHSSFEVCAKHRPMRQPLTIGAFTIPHSPALPITELPIQQLLESPKPNGSLSDDLRRLFIHNPATFYHGTSDFYTLKKNTRVPEICILGRSNVGKSTLVNALANRRENELAHTSARAGRTRAMNAFGFGPAPTMKELADTDKEIKRTEDLPKHSVYILDMPGYGHKSLKDWGKNISLYLHKRKSIIGAIVLIDGEVGPKANDKEALELLCQAGVRTAIVLTKADKAKDQEMLRNNCKELWETMREIQNQNLESGWKWEKDFFVTAVGATKKEIGADTVDVARLAIARLAGLVQEKQRPELGEAKGYSGKIVSFEDIMFAASQKSQHSARPSSMSGARLSTRSSSGLTALEYAAKEQHRSKSAISRSSPRLASSRCRFLHIRGFHRSRTLQAGRGPRPGPNNTRPSPSPIKAASSGEKPSQDIKAILKDFISSLKATAEKDRPSEGQHKIFNPFAKQQTRRFRAHMKEETAKRQDYLDIVSRRIEREEMKRQRQENMHRRAEAATRQPRWQQEGNPARDEGFDGGAEDDAFARAWNEVEGERPLKGKKARQAEQRLTKQERMLKDKSKDTDADEFEAKFAAAAR